MPTMLIFTLLFLMGVGALLNAHLIDYRFLSGDVC